MKVPYSWIKEFVDIEEDPNIVAERLNETGLETTVEKFGEYIPNLITVRITSVKKHPEKDKLFVCEATDGQKTYQIITGADNVKENQVVILAKEGAVIKGQEIKPVKFGSFESEGMFLSLEELGLEDESEGILLLGEDAPIGVDASKLLNLGEDYIFEVEITPNRGDALSVKGLAREIAAIFNKKRKEINPNVSIGKEKNPQISVETEKVNRYRGIVIENVEVKDSPFEIKLKLIKSGQKPINNVVDITNYILLQEGQPLHAFDLDKIEGQIHVRNAKEGEVFVALDGNEYNLKETDIVIADDKKVLALGGIIGGENSKVDENTKHVLLEAAHFEPSAIRKTAKRLGINTESSYRFERGVDIESLPLAQDKAVELIEKIASGKPVGEKEIYQNVYTPKTIKLREKTTKRVLGENIPKEEACEILNRLEIPTQEVEDGTVSQIPAFRAYDLQREIDLVEEVGRLKGLNNLEETYPAVPTLSYEKPEWYMFEQKTRQFFLDNGLNEVLTYTFVGEEIYNKLGLTPPNLRIVNYILKSQSVMRDNLTVSLIDVLKENLRHQTKDVAVFEISSAFFDDLEEIRAGILVSGKIIDGYRYTKEKTTFSTDLQWDFLKVKGLLLSYLASLGFKDAELQSADLPFLNRYESADIFIDGKNVGFFGKVHPKKAEELKIPKNTYVGELKLKPVSRELQPLEKEDYLFTLYKRRKTPAFQPLPKFPPVKRDLAFEVPEDFEVGKLIHEIKNSCKFAKKVKLFDVYYLGNGKKSVAVSVEFNADDRNLSDEEVNSIVEELIKELEERLDVKLRT